MQVNLTANTDLHTADDFKKLVVRQDKNTLVRLGDIADIVLGAEDYNTEVRFSGQKAVFMGIWVLPNANSLDVIKRVRVELQQIKKELPKRHDSRDMAYDATAYINDAIHEVVKTLIDTLLIVMRGDLFVPRLGPICRRPDCRDSDLANRRSVFNAAVRVQSRTY